jgi:hypothetical protein
MYVASHVALLSTRYVRTSLRMGMVAWIDLARARTIRIIS